MLCQYAEVFEHAHDAILVLDSEYRVLAVNEAYSALSGFHAGDVVGQELPALRRGVQGVAFSHDILARVARDYPGQVLKVEFEQDEGGHCQEPGGRAAGCWRYEFKILQDQGRLVKLEVDARTGEVVRVSTRPLRRGGRHP